MFLPLNPLLKGISKSRDQVTDLQSEVQRGYETYPKNTEQLVVTWIQILTSESPCSETGEVIDQETLAVVGEV